MNRFYKTILGVTSIAVCLSSGVFAMESEEERNPDRNRQIVRAAPPGLVERLERDQSTLNMSRFPTWAASLDFLRINDPTLFLEHPYVGEAFEGFVRLAATNTNIFPSLTFEGRDNSSVNMGMFQSALYCSASGRDATTPVNFRSIAFTPQEINRVLSNNPIMNTTGITIDPNALIGWKIWFFHNAEGFMRAAEAAVVKAITAPGDQGAVVDLELKQRIDQARRINTQLMRCVSSHVNTFMYDFLSRMGQLPRVPVGGAEPATSASALAMDSTDPDLRPFSGDLLELLNILPLAQMRQIGAAAHGNTPPPPAQPQLP